MHERRGGVHRPETFSLSLYPHPNMTLTPFSSNSTLSDDLVRLKADLRELTHSFEYAYAMGHGCSLGWHPSFEVVRREVAELRARLAADDDDDDAAYGESS